MPAQNEIGGFSNREIEWQSDQSRDLSKSGSNDPNSLAFKGGKSLFACAVVGNQNVDFVGRANKGWADPAEFARVGGYDHLLGLLQHLANDQRFIGLQSRGSPFRFQTRDAEKHLIHIDVVKKVECGAPGERK